MCFFLSLSISIDDNNELSCSTHTAGEQKRDYVRPIRMRELRYKCICLLLMATQHNTNDDGLLSKLYA